LRSVDSFLAGAVLNNVDLERTHHRDYYYAGYYYYTDDERKPQRRRPVEDKVDKVGVG